jgi:hypothetical protein
LDPATLLRVCCRNDLGAVKDQGEGVTCGRVGRIWERLLPRFEDFRGSEFDIDEEVLSGARDLGTGNPPQNFDSARNSHTLGFSRVRLNLITLNGGMLCGF